MPDLTISQLTQVAYSANYLIAAVDMTAPVGLKNVALTLGEIVAAASGGAPVGAVAPLAVFAGNGASTAAPSFVTLTGAYLASAVDNVTIKVVGNVLSVVAGTTGAQGPAGAMGAQGPAGATGAQGPAGATGSNASITTMTTGTSFALTDYIGISNGTTDAKVTFATFLAGASTSVAALPAAGVAAASDGFPVVQGANVALQTVAALASYVFGNLTSYIEPLLEVTASVTLDAAAHNGRVLIFSQPATVTQGVFTSGFECDLINLSGGTVSFATGITVLGGSSLANNQGAKFRNVTYSGGSVALAILDGSTIALPLTISTPATASTTAAFNASGSVGTSGAAVQVALSQSNSVVPTGGFTAATVSGNAWSASLTEATAGTWYVWAQLAGSPSVTAVSGAIVVSAGGGPAETITVNTITAPVANTAFTVSGTYANGTPTALDYSRDGGSTWTAAAATISGGTYSFNASGLPAGSYSIEVRDHNATTVIGTSNSFTIVASTNATIASQSGSFTFSASATYPFPSTIAHGTGVSFQVGVAGATNGDTFTKEAYFTTSVPTTQPASGGQAGTILSNATLIGWAPLTSPATPGTYYLSVWLTDTTKSLSGYCVMTPITVT